MNKIDIEIKDNKVGELFYDKENKEYGFNYTSNISPISLIMPYKVSTYDWKYHLHPIFEMNLPEGYLFEIFKNHLSKEYGYIDDFLVFSCLAPNIEGRLGFKSEFAGEVYDAIDIDNVLKNDTNDTFLNLVKTFLNKNAISGVQPKTLALLREKQSLFFKEYIIKTWGDEYKELALNEYFCLKATQKAGVKIPNIRLSNNNKFLLVQRFNYDDSKDEYLGFEEVLVLQGKNRENKYSGSYEQVAKTIYAVTTNKEESMISLYKTIVMNYLLKNGDAHLKNFGILYSNDLKQRYYSPAYDIVCTTAYMFKDKPALSMFGKKVWFGEKELIRFGVKYCYLSPSKAKQYFDECLEALKSTKKEVQKQINKNSNFKDIGTRMIDSWDILQTHKEIPDEIIRNWK